MQIGCGNCEQTFSWEEFETENSDIMECPGCGVRFSIKSNSTVTHYGAEIYKSTVEVLEAFPKIILEAGSESRYAWEEFFASISNKNTKRAYKRIILNFLDFVTLNNLKLSQISPKVCRQFFDESDLSLSSKKQSLSALRHFFDFQVTRHAVLINPAKSIRLDRLVYTKGKTIPLTSEEVQRIIELINLKSPIDLRDRVIIGILAYTGCRIASLYTLNCEDIILNKYGTRVNLKEKNGKINEVPIRSNLLYWIKEYQNYVGIRKGALFRKFIGKNFEYNEDALSLSSIQKIVKKRIKLAGINNKSAHSFRAGVATSLLQQGISQEEVQTLLGHSDPRTTQLYDHSKKCISQNIVERI